MVLVVLGISTLLQLAAAAAALQILRRTRRRGWALIAAGVGLMAVRRVLTLTRILGEPGYTPDLAAESVALLVSILILGGILLIGPVFRRLERGEDALRRWNHVMLKADWGFATTGRDGARFESMNPAFARMHGYRVDELVGKPLETVYPSHDPEEVRKNLTEARWKGHHVIECEHVRKDGSTFPVAKTVTVLTDERGHVDFHAAHVEEITERKRAEQELRDRATRLRLLLEQMPAVMWTVDRDLRILSATGSGLKALGLAPDQLVGVRLQDYFGTEDPGFPPLTAQRRAVAGESVRFETVWQGRTYESYVEPLRDEQGGITGAIGVAHDITDHTSAQTALRASHETLRRLTARLQHVREEERTAIAREVHDEFGQALTGLKLDLAWLRGHLSPGSAPRERVESMLAVADATLDAARSLSARLRPALLDELGLEAALESLGREFTQRTGCPCALDLAASDLGLDRTRDTAVFRIVQEALTNVARHAGARRVEIRLHTSPAGIRVEVEDDGRGITDPEIASPGALGLTGMRERALALGGDVAFARGARGGTVVTLRLPQPAAQEALP